MCLSQTLFYNFIIEQRLLIEAQMTDRLMEKVIYFLCMEAPESHNHQEFYVLLLRAKLGQQLCKTVT